MRVCHRIVKLFFPQPDGEHDHATAEYLAYCSLIAQRVCLPPSDTGAKRIVPYCYSLVSRHNLRLQMKRHTLWKGPAKQMLREGPLCGLLMEFLPDCTTVMADPARLANQPELADDIVAALRTIHGAGVLHRDPLPRNMMLDPEGGVWWVDFGLAENTAYSAIHGTFCDSEVRRVDWLLRNDVIPAVREGRMAVWESLGQ
ncbi:hypothetical protein FN846DRAFT_997408 [Sphaerosporella brunnea]|uniref:Protein kinase domain-containing protein n=1 Tax=Sphaerosporella brunnea TaxID=1250544 RepID=A0A5J5F648_9PEZI|nr:hypothetical protein FN846DRAFT_997408 [Sphaerosporella brunnea]